MTGEMLHPGFTSHDTNRRAPLQKTERTRTNAAHGVSRQKSRNSGERELRYCVISPTAKSNNLRQPA